MRVDITAQFRELAPARPRSTKHHDAFTTEATTLLSSMQELEKVLRRVRPNYLKPKCFVRIKGSHMSEKDKEELDADLVDLIKTCTCRIDALKATVEAQPAVESVGEYQREVVAYLYERLKSSAATAKQMQKRRFQQLFLLSSRLLPEDDRLTLDALEQQIQQTRQEDASSPLRARSTPSTTVEPSKRSSLDPPVASQTPSPVTPPLQAEPKNPLDHQRYELQDSKPPRTRSKRPVGAAQHAPLAFTDEETRRFQVENVRLHRHLQENLEDAKNMEAKMGAISTLMSQFADKIMDQHHDIALIQQHAQATTANLTQSNRILQQTQTIGAGYGFLLFCLYLGFSTLLHLLHYFHS